MIVAAHLGRPKGEPDPTFSLAPVAARLGELLGTDVPLAADVAGDDAQAKAAALGDGDVLLLENVRFEAAETSKDDAARGELADRLAALAEFYVDDAFGAVHRKHASVFDIAERLPHAVGRLVEREVEVLTRLTESPDRPYVVVLGGSKVSDKLAVIEALLPKVDRLLVGGGMCFTFLAAQGHGVGKSLLEADQVDTCRRLLDEAGDRIVLPVDVVCAPEFSADVETTSVAADAIPDGQMGLDVGPRTVEAFGGRAGRRDDGVLERPDGRVRAGSLPGGHPRGGAVRRGRRRALRRRWRGLGRRRPGARPRRGRLRPHQHRRRRVAGVPRGPGAPGPRGTR